MCCLRDILGISLWNEVQNTDILERTRMVQWRNSLGRDAFNGFATSGECPPAVPKDSY